MGKTHSEETGCCSFPLGPSSDPFEELYSQDTPCHTAEDGATRSDRFSLYMGKLYSRSEKGSKHETSFRSEIFLCKTLQRLQLPFVFVCHGFNDKESRSTARGESKRRGEGRKRMKMGWARRVEEKKKGCA